MAEVDLDELERLHRESDMDPLKSHHIVSPGYTHMANLTEVIGRGRCIAMLPKTWADWIAASENAAPSLIAELRRLRKIEAAARKVSAACDKWPNAGLSGLSAMDAALDALDVALATGKI